MNTTKSVVIPTIAFLFLAGSAMAEVQQNQATNSTSFLQTDESAEFAAYEFETSDENSEAETMTKKEVRSTDDTNEWTPEDWTEIP